MSDRITCDQNAYSLMVETARDFGGQIHGDDQHGRWDIQFPSLVNAGRFTDSMTREGRFFYRAALSVALRDPVTVNRLEDLNAVSCTVTVTLNPQFGRKPR